jgi:outer membrane protein assembly factor BamD
MTVSPVWRRLGALAPLLAAALLAACSSTPKESASSPKAVQQLYADAKADMESGNYDAAAKSFERLEGLAAGSLIGQQATLDLAYVHYRAGDKTEAIATLDRFIKLHPSSPALDYALYLRGLVNFNDNSGFLSSFARQDMSERDQQASRDAYQSFKQLTEQFPNSKYAPDARLRMSYITNALAKYELHVASYYYRRGAYLAAADRAQQAVQEFELAPSTEEALYIMVESYDKLGLTQLRDDAGRVLKRNFPNSRYLAEGLGTQKKAWWQLW